MTIARILHTERGYRLEIETANETAKIYREFPHRYTATLARADYIAVKHEENGGPVANVGDLIREAIALPVIETTNWTMEVATEESMSQECVRLFEKSEQRKNRLIGEIIQ